MSQTTEKYHEFGVESVPPDDDFAYWVTRKERGEAARRLVESVRDGFANMPK